MRYDISFSTTIEMVTDYLPGLVLDPQLGLDYNMNLHFQIREEKSYPIIISHDGIRALTPLKWGIEVAPGIVSFNAQSERILNDKKSRWYRRRNSRCLIPVTGIYEHREIKGWKKKVPYYVKLKNRSLFCIPGLYSASQNSFALITRPGNDIMRQIHNSGDNPYRMPLFLADKHLEERWLASDLEEAEMEAILDYELPSENLEYYPVHTIRTQKERPDKKQKDEPFNWPDLPPLGKDSNELSLF